MSSTLLPVLLALGAAVLFAFGNQCSRLALQFTDSQTATLYQIGTGAALYWLAAPFYMKAEYWTSPVLLLLAAIGLLRPLVSANLGMAGTRILGPTISSTLSGTAPLFGISLGVVWLSESLSWEVAVGAAGMVIGVITLSWRRGSAVSWPLLALLLPVGAAFIRSLAHAVAKVGLEVLPSPFFVAMMAYTVSFPLALMVASRRGERQQRHWSWPPAPGAGLKWMITTGLMYGFAVLLLNTALLTGQLVVVSPLVACTPVITMLLGYFIFREQTLSRRVIIAVLIVVPSVALIGVRG